MKEIHDLVARQEVCVLATVEKAMPHCSFMAYISDEDCRNIYMVTHTDTRKFENMCANPAVSLLIDSRLWNETTDRDEMKALTVKGKVEEIHDEEFIESLRKRFVNRHGHLKEFAESDKAVVFAVAVESFQLQRGADDGVYEYIDRSSERR